MIFESSALLSFSEDIQNRSFTDWIKAHISFMYPLHAYNGRVRIEGNMFMFSGAERKTGNDFQLNIFRNEIEELYLGYDNVFTVFETRNLGFGWKPIRITFTRNQRTLRLYLIVNYSLGKTDNAIWLEILKNWLRA